MLLLLNAHWEELGFTLPETRKEHVWETMLDTALAPDEVPEALTGGRQYKLYGRTLALLRTRPIDEPAQMISTVQAATLRKEARRANQPSGNDPPLVG